MEAPGKKVAAGGLLLAGAWILDLHYTAVPRPAPLTDLAYVLDHDGFLPLLALIVSAYTLLDMGGKRTGILVSGLLLAAAVTAALKAGVEAPRPYLVYDVGTPHTDVNPLYSYGTASFPSMHATVAFALYAGLERGLQGWPRRAALASAAAVALSRPLIFRHFFLEVAIGGGIGYLSVRGVRLVKRRLEK